MKKLSSIVLALILMVTLAACSTVSAESAPQAAGIQNSSYQPAATGAAATATVAVENVETHEEAGDYVWDSADVIPIVLEGDTITAANEGVTVEGSKATLTAAGTYSITGTLSDGQIVVDTDDEEVVRLLLSGVDIRNTTGAPINIVKAEKTVIELVENTENYVADAETYVFETPDTDEPNAAIFSKGDLTIFGSGSLTVEGNFNDGISSKDGLIIASGTISVHAVDDGIRGKDYVLVKDGNITIDAQGDGLKLDNEEDPAKGFITVDAGTVDITAGGDAITAQTSVTVLGGEFTLTTGGGSGNRVDETLSAKGIKGGSSVEISGASFTIDSADDALHTNGIMTVYSGTFNLATGDDGLHADAALTINDGKIDITNSYEGLESAVITINAGDINIKSSDDGINIAGGNDGSGMNPGMGPGGNNGQGMTPGMRPGGNNGTGTNPGMGPGGNNGTGTNPGMGPGGMQAPGGVPGAGPGGGQDTFASSGDYFLYIHGGTITVEAAGDGIDVNGAIEMTGGTVLVNGPTQQMNAALDYDASFNITGGLLVAVGSSGMAQSPGATSTQNSILVNFNTTLPAGTLVYIQNSAGEEILTFAPAKDYQSIAFSSPQLEMGATYDLYVGGSSSGTSNGGLFQGGSYTPGTPYSSFTISSAATRLGSGGNRP